MIEHELAWVVVWKAPGPRGRWHSYPDICEETRRAARNRHAALRGKPWSECEAEGDRVVRAALSWEAPSHERTD
jgi:hypothetical protein